jgi:hypothetical protein
MADDNLPAKSNSSPPVATLLEPRPLAQGVLSNTIFQLLWNGVPYVVTWITTHIAAVRGLDTHWLILLGVAVFALASLGMNQLHLFMVRRRQHTTQIVPLTTETAAPEIEELTEQVRLLTSERDALEAQRAEHAAAIEQVRAEARRIRESAQPHRKRADVLEGEARALKTRLESAEAEKVDLKTKLTQADEQLAALRIEVGRLMKPQVDLTLEKETHPHLNQARHEFYIVVTSRVTIDDLTVEIERMTIKDQDYFHVPLLEKGDAPPYKRVFTIEPGQPKAFHIASIVNFDPPTLYTATPEAIPEGIPSNQPFHIVVRGSNTLPLKRGVEAGVRGGHVGRYPYVRLHEEINLGGIPRNM